MLLKGFMDNDLVFSSVLGKFVTEKREMEACKWCEPCAGLSDTG
jgi:hypothetical protein